MASETRRTTDHDEIRQWVEQHDGSPAVVRGTGSKNSLGVLRFDFPGGAGEDKLEHIDWEEWFDTFDSNNLALLYQEQKSSGETAHSPSSSGGTSHSSRPLCRTLTNRSKSRAKSPTAGTTSWPRSPGSLRARGMSPGHSPRYELTGAGMLILTGGRRRSAMDYE